MKTIFQLEFKRLQRSKLTIALALVIGVYSYYVMQQDIILGVDGTTPYSRLSCVTYVKSLLPVLLAGMTMLACKPFYKQERKVFVLFHATSMDKKVYYFTRFLVIALGCLLLCSIPVLFALVVYCKTFA